MKLHQILGRILTDVALRQSRPKDGVCFLVDSLAEEAGADLHMEFRAARKACMQTTSHIYPVMGPRGETYRGADWGRAEYTGTMWRGEYGMNRRKLVRDCWRWAKERDV